MTKSSLRRQLVLPYVLLVIFVSTAIGWVSYQAGEEAVDTLSRRILADTVQRISASTEEHLSRALVALHSIDPDPATLPEPQPFSDDLSRLESRFWVASGLFMDINNYVYFGGADGRFIGVNRVSKDLVELYRRDPGAARRSVYASNQPGQRQSLLRRDDYDPRERPWYTIAAAQARPVWSPVYNDFTSKEPTITLAKAVRRADQSLAGVVATDVTLKVLTEFLRTLSVSDNGVAFVIDGDGYMVATSGQELPFRMVNGQPERMHVTDMQSTMIRQAYAGIHNWKMRDGDAKDMLALSSGPIEIAAGELGARYGVDWITVVAVPKSDFTGGVRRSFVQGMLIAILCVMAAIAIGLSLINRVLGDIRRLNEAARRIGEGEPLPKLDLRRRDELGQLAMSFSEMEHNLRIDKLTAVFNRASLIAQIAFLRRQLDQKNGERPQFALLFIDLDHFKKVNDQHGHAAGDRVLATVAARLKESVRVTDVVARYGGDEFVVLLKGLTPASDVMAMEEKIRTVVEAPVPLEHGIARVGVSIGWAMFPDDGEDIEALLKIADKRMFDAKRVRKAALAQTSST
ncbi:MAG TPA: diguanylate cyclase [Noviherbaspirillum sp.]|jgi:diguanylate cyclase (GGDEF)-like protein|uniref:GGDEF domain-containing protein n=1 Tax=Noviherbaspirillum sp. TaxID=1926288 RepID=UPI002F93F302